MEKRRAFTLVELLISITIIAIMAVMGTVAMMGAMESAKAKKTQALIAKLDAIIQNRWEQYQTRRIPLEIEDEKFHDTNSNGRFDPGVDFLFADLDGDGMQGPGEESYDTNSNGQWDSFPAALRARIRLDALHDLMRMEMPDRFSDITDNPTVFSYVSGHAGGISQFQLTRPSLNMGFARHLLGAPNGTGDYAGAECLYMIVKNSVGDDGDAVDVLKQDSIGDVDKDGLPEIVDAWGMPIRFLRWAPGFHSGQNILATGRVTSFVRGSAGAPPATPPTPTVMRAANANTAGTNETPIFSQAIGTYTNCAIYFDSGNLKHHSAVISNFAWAPDQVTFTFNFEPNYPFGSSNPSPGDTFVVLATDPFDPQRVHNTNHAQIFPSGTRGTPFATSPLLYSAGGDKAYGIRGEMFGTDNSHPDFPNDPFRYSRFSVDPFVVTQAGEMMGETTDLPTEQKSNAWMDNIHNQSGISR